MSGTKQTQNTRKIEQWSETYLSDLDVLMSYRFPVQQGLTNLRLDEGQLLSLLHFAVSRYSLDLGRVAWSLYQQAMEPQGVCFSQCVSNRVLYQKSIISIAFLSSHKLWRFLQEIFPIVDERMLILLDRLSQMYYSFN